MSLSTILSQAYNFFSNNIKRLAMLMLPILFVQSGVQQWLTMAISSADASHSQLNGSHIAAIIILLLVFSLMVAALTLFMNVESSGRHLSTTEILKESLNYMPKLLLAGVLSGLIISGPAIGFMAIAAIVHIKVLGVIGVLLSIYMSIRLVYVNFMVVVEQRSPLQAIKGSFTFSGPIIFQTLLLLFLYIPLLIIGAPLSKLTSGFGMPLILIVDSLFAFLCLFVNIALFRLYMVTRQTTQQDS